MLPGPSASLASVTAPGSLLAEGARLMVKEGYLGLALEREGSCPRRESSTCCPQERLRTLPCILGWCTRRCRCPRRRHTYPWDRVCIGLPRACCIFPWGKGPRTDERSPPPCRRSGLRRRGQRTHYPLAPWSPRPCRRSALLGSPCTLPSHSYWRTCPWGSMYNRPKTQRATNSNPGRSRCRSRGLYSCEDFSVSCMSRSRHLPEQPHAPLSRPTLPGSQSVHVDDDVELDLPATHWRHSVALEE